MQYTLNTNPDNPKETEMNTKISRREFNLTLAAGTLGLMAGCSINNKFDIVIKNGLIIDGSGGPAYKKDIGIIGNTIVAIDDLKSSTADMMIDGEGLVVSPDFIDIHTHTDIQLLVNSKAESKIHQGVTTEVSGNCGDSPFPIRDEDFQDYDERIFEEYGIHIDWRDTDGYLRSLENHKISINHATLTGQGTLRSNVVGNNDVQATPEQINEMKYLLEQSIKNKNLQEGFCVVQSINRHILEDLLIRTRKKRDTLSSALRGGHNLDNELATNELSEAILNLAVGNIREAAQIFIHHMDSRTHEFKLFEPLFYILKFDRLKDIVKYSLSCPQPNAFTLC